MQILMNCFSALNIPPSSHVAKFKKVDGDPINADFNLSGAQVFAQDQQRFALSANYKLTVSDTAPGGTPLLRLKLSVTSSSQLPTGFYRTAFKMVAGDPLNVGISDATLQVQTISPSEFSLGQAVFLDYIAA